MVLMTWAKAAQGCAAGNADTMRRQSIRQQVERRPKKISTNYDIVIIKYLQLFIALRLRHLLPKIISSHIALPQAPKTQFEE